MLSFQVIDIRGADQEEDDEDAFVVWLFGRTSDDRSVSVQATGYCPSFYVSLARGVTVGAVLSSLGRERRARPHEHRVVSRLDFDGFHGDERFPFVQLSFKTSRAMRCAVRVGTEAGWKLYESNLDPVLRFMHVTGVSGGSWVRVAGVDPGPSGGPAVTAEVPYGRLSADESARWEVAPWRVLSYDIEATSTAPDGGFPLASRPGDAVIQIGVSVNRFRDPHCYRRLVLCLLEVERSPDFEVRCFGTERELLLGFVRVLQEEDPDVLIGYNTFGFDNLYMMDRAELLGVSSAFSRWGRRGGPCRAWRKKALSSSALGDNSLSYFEAEGRLQIDVMKVVQRDHSLESYKLDAVSSFFNQFPVESVLSSASFTTQRPPPPGSWLVFRVVDESSGVEDESERARVVAVDGETVEVAGAPVPPGARKWSPVKDDVPAAEIFRLFAQGPSERLVVARYCLQDCVLVNQLCERLDVLSTNLAMSNVCWVPPQHIFTRGQGVKAFSLVTRETGAAGFVVPAVSKADLVDVVYRGPIDRSRRSPLKECSYDFCCSREPLLQAQPAGWQALLHDRQLFLRGARVSHVRRDAGGGGFVVSFVGSAPDAAAPDLSSLRARGGGPGRVAVRCLFETERGAVCGVCLRVQYSSSYKGAAVLDPEPFLHYSPISVLDYASLYPRSMVGKNISWDTEVRDRSKLGLPGYAYHRASYEECDGTVVECVFAEKAGEKGVVPRILWRLMEERSATRRRAKSEPDAFRRKVLDSHQLALKVTANSLYGQMGALTSPLYRKSLAACTTSTGQEMLRLAKRYLEVDFVGVAGLQTAPRVVYGDTDSVFVDFGLGTDREARRRSIELGQLASRSIRLPAPHDLEYEKTFHPWVVLKKKKYAGVKYGTDPDKGSVSFMGIVLKRRDNAKIVKKVCGHVLRMMLDIRPAQQIVEETRRLVADVRDGRFGLDFFSTSKKLKASYKNPQGVAHAALAARMRSRDPGSAPQVNDRVSFVQVFDPSFDKSTLQGDRVEETSEVQRRGLAVDYLYYIRNQVMVPACQLLELVVPDPKRAVFDEVVASIEAERGRLLRTGGKMRTIDSYFGRSSGIKNRVEV